MTARPRRIESEIAHVLFLDIVAYSRRPMEEQQRLRDALRAIVRAAPEYQTALERELLISCDTGDGVALVFFRDPLAPVQCALEITEALQTESLFELRAGIHSGPVARTPDFNTGTNVSGGGINIARRVMECGDPGHILLSGQSADVITQYEEWEERIQPIGEVEIKHGKTIPLFNLCGEGYGNPAVPSRLTSSQPVQSEAKPSDAKSPDATGSAPTVQKPAAAPDTAAVPTGDSDLPPFRNPYDFGPPATSAMFKGRKAEIDQLLDAVESDTHVAVFGLQRIGKTSLVEETFQKRLDERPALRDSIAFAQINFQELGSETVTYRDLFEAIVSAIADVMPGGERATLKRAVEGFLSNAQEYQRGKRPPFLRDAERVLERIAELSPRKVVLFLDEFSELCRANERNEELLRRKPNRDAKLHPYEMLGDVSLLRWFSSLLKNRELKSKLIFIFAIRPFVAQYDSERELQILKLTSPVCLYYLDAEAAKSLITDPLKGLMEYEEGAVDYLYQLTAGHPYLIQFFLKSIVNQVRKTRNRILLQDILDFEQRMISEGPAYEAQFALLDSDYSVDEALNPKRANLGRGTLALISRLGNEKTEGWVSKEEITQELRARGCSVEEVDTILYQLDAAKIIEQSTVRGQHCYRVMIPLLRKRYVKQNMYMRYFQELRR